MEEPLSDLIQKHFNGTITPAEFARLQLAMVEDSAAADEFARAGRMDAVLAKKFAEDGGIETSSRIAEEAVMRFQAGDDYLPVLRKRSKYSAAKITATTTAAILILVVGAAYLFMLNVAVDPVRQRVHEVSGGRAIIDGNEGRAAVDGSRIEAIDAIVVTLADRSVMELSPGSIAQIRGEVDGVRQVIALSKGDATFSVEKGDRQFRVETPLGDVSVLGTKFEVRLQEFNPEEGEIEMWKRSVLTLAVAVATGTVEVQVGGKTMLLSAGQSHVFADERPANVADFNRRPDTMGKFLGADEKAGTLRIAGKENRDGVTFAVAKDLKVFGEGGKSAKLSDVAEGTPVALFLNADKSTVLALRVEAARGEEGGGLRSEMYGVVVGIEGSTLRFARSTDSAPKAVTLNISPNAQISIDNRPAKASDLPPNAVATVFLTDDLTSVVAIRVSLKPDRRMIQTVDTQKMTVQFRAEGRELIFPLDKEVKVTIDGREAKVSDLTEFKADIPATVLMSPDRKTVMAITVGKGGGRPVGAKDGEKPRGEGDKPRDPNRPKDGEKPKGKGDGDK